MARRKHSTLPTSDELLKPVVQALLLLGGSGTIEEIDETVYKILNLSSESLQIQHGANGRSEIEYRLAWARTYLKAAGIIVNSARKVWALAGANITADSIDNTVVTKLARQKLASKEQTVPIVAIPINENENDETAGWREELLRVLLNISPAAFEKLTQRLLRESGFTQVEVTGKTGDGGIDGKGIVRINGFLSFHVIFQCKRYQGSISSGQVRDFRGAMQGRADKGIFITTGTFSREATREATRDGAPPIGLIDGELLCEKLKELRLGVETEQIEVVKVQAEWFEVF